MKTPLIAAVLAGGLVTAQAQQFSGSPTTTGPIDRVGDVTTFGRLGIGTPPTVPASPYLQFSSEVGNRKIVLFDGIEPNDNQFVGLGVNVNTFRFQLAQASNSFRFYRGDSPTASTELFTVTGEGRVGVGTPNPLNKLQVAGSIGQVSQGPFEAPNSRFTAIGDPPGAFPTGLGRFYGIFEKSSLQSLFVGLASNPAINPTPETEPDPSVRRDAVIGFQDQTSTDPNVGNRLRIGFISGVARTAQFNERITVLANGFTGFGVTDPMYRVELPNIPSEAGQIRANAFVTYGFVPKGNSSARPLTGATAKLAVLRSVEWQQPDGQRALGFVPAEVAQAVPEAVVLAADGTTVAGLNDAAFTPLLLQAVQELTQRLAEKDQALLALEARLTKLEGAAAAPADARTAPALGQPEGPLQQNRPNPFSAETTIDFALPPTATHAVLLVYDEQGKQVKSWPIANAQQRSVTLSAGALPAGVYSYKIMVDGKVVGAKKMILTR